MCWAQAAAVLAGQVARLSAKDGGMGERECPSAEETHPLLLGVENGTALQETLR